MDPLQMNGNWLAVIAGAVAAFALGAAWYDEDHYHAGIGLMTPDQIHFGQADARYAARQTALGAAFLSTPISFVHQPPKPPQVPTAVWIDAAMRHAGLLN